MFWHKLSEMMSILIIVYFSLPGALVSSYFCQQSMNGQFDTLFSLPGSLLLEYLFISTRNNNFLLCKCMDFELLFHYRASNILFYDFLLSRLTVHNINHPSFRTLSPWNFILYVNLYRFILILS